MLITSGSILVIVGLALIIKRKSFAMYLFKHRCRREFTLQQKIQGLLLISLILEFLFFLASGLWGYTSIIKKCFVGFTEGMGICVLSGVWLIIGIKAGAKLSTTSYSENSIAFWVNRLCPIFWLILGMCILLGVGLVLRVLIGQGLFRFLPSELVFGTIIPTFIIGGIFIFWGCYSIIKRFDSYHYLFGQQVITRSFQIPILFLAISITSLGICLILKGIFPFFF